MFEVEMKVKFHCNKCGRKESFDIDGLYPEEYFKEDIEAIGWEYIDEDAVNCPECKTKEEAYTTNKVEINQPAYQIKLDPWNKLGLFLLSIQRRFT